MLAFRAFLFKICTKRFIPVTDIFCGIIKGVPEVSGTSFLHMRIQNMIPPVLGEVEVVDYSNLEKEILDASELDLTKYTEETVKVFKEALEKAQAVMENSDATQAEADAAVAGLRSAIDALETLNEKPEKSEKPEKPEVPERPSKPSDNKLVDDSVKTGDASSFTYWIIVMVGVVVVGIVVICRRKYR